MKRKLLGFYAMALLAVIAACEQQIDMPVLTEEQAVAGAITNEWADNPYKLNVVYFVPSDNDTIIGYQDRLSKILLDAQTFFADELERNGLERRSYGLDLINDSLVNIVVVPGALPKADYPYSGGGGVAIPEIDAYFASNPSEKLSEHYLVILPTNSTDPQDPAGDVPFYGLGRYCFALDYEQLDSRYLGEDSHWGGLATTYIGGLVHELGHGLNAPHDFGTAGDSDSFGTNLMGAGNSSYGRTPTFISRASAAVFHAGQTFSPATRTDWHQDFSFSLEALESTLEDGHITLSGSFTSGKEIEHVLAYYDPEPYGGNQDYDAITFATSPSGTTFTLSCPLDEFVKRNGKYQLSLRFISVNGLRKEVSFLVTFSGEVPDLSKVLILPLTDRSGWTVTTSSAQAPTSGEDMLDSDIETIWHSPYSPSLVDHPHTLTFDMQEETNFSKVLFYNRANLTGAMQSVNLQVSHDGAAWTDLGLFEIPQIAGPCYVDLPEEQSARYIRVITQNSHEGIEYTHLAEFGVY